MMVQSRVFFWNPKATVWDQPYVPSYLYGHLAVTGMGIYDVSFRVSKIQHLDLDRLPALRSMCKLDLSHYQLHELPEAIGSLPSLTHLFLNDNHLTFLQPEIIRRLVNLQELDLRNNKLNNFLLDITELSCLRRLSVQGNPLKDDEKRKLMKLAHSERWIDIAGECKSFSRNFGKLWIDFLKVLRRYSFPVPVVGPSALSLPPKTLKISSSRFALEKNFELDL